MAKERPQEPLATRLVRADPADPSSYLLEPAFVELREKLLRLSPRHPTFADLPPVPVLAALMEMGLQSSVATVAAVADGTCSILLGRGPMIIGTGERAQVRAAGKAFLDSAAAYILKCLPAKSFPLPACGKVRFYIISPTRVYTAQANERELECWHSFSELFQRGHDLIYAIGQAVENNEPETHG